MPSIPTTRLAIAGLFLAVACTKRDTPSDQTAASADRASSSETAEAAPFAEVEATQELPPLEGAWLEPLELEGGGKAYVSVPLGATRPRPVMVSVHGAGDRPEWACGGWRGVTDAFPFIVCPQGAPTKDDRFFWQSTRALGELTERAVALVRARFGPYVSRAPMLYAGFSAGAIYGAALVRDSADEFPTAAFVEGGYDQLDDPTFAARFHDHGGRRVLLGCSTGLGCLSKMSKAHDLFVRAGVEVRVNDAGSVGHNLNAEAVRSLKRDWRWLVSDKEGWENYATSEPRVHSKTEMESAQHPVEVTEEELPDDLPAFFLRGEEGTHLGIVFLTGACTHPQGYMQAFQFAAHAKGSMLGPQGDVALAETQTRRMVDLPLHERRARCNRSPFAVEATIALQQ